MVMFIFRIFRLSFIAFMTTYFVGCFWWMLGNILNSKYDKLRGQTFKYRFGFNEYFTSNSPELCKSKACLEHISEGGKTNCYIGDWVQKNCHTDYSSQAIIVCYYALTTLSTIGYGDFYPISWREQVVGVIFMLAGIVFFAQIMG